MSNTRSDADTPVEGCLHDGYDRREHGQRWWRGVGWHDHVAPDPALMHTRMRAKRERAAMQRYRDALASGLSLYEAHEAARPAPAPPAYDVKRTDDRGHIRVVCKDPDCRGCMFCAGGLYACEVCGGGEATMTTQCCGRRLTDDEQDQVQSLRIDFLHNRWWTADLAIATPAEARTGISDRQAAALAACRELRAELVKDRQLLDTVIAILAQPQVRS